MAHTDVADGSDQDTPLGTAICAGCDTRTDVYQTEFGLRCEECKEYGPTHPDCDDCNDYDELTDWCELCKVYDPMEMDTYAPTLHEDTTDEWEEEAIDNANEFKENLPDIGFNLELADGSTYEMDEFKSNAAILKHGEDWEVFLDLIVNKINEHFQKQTEPTRFVEYASWGASSHEESQSDYETQADLAPVVIYSHLRGALMQMSLSAMSNDKEDEPRVVGINTDSISVYSTDGRVTVEYSDDETPSKAGENE